MLLRDRYAAKGTTALTTADTGQAWDATKGFPNDAADSLLSIVGGKLTNTSTSASIRRGYAQVNLGESVTVMGCKATFTNAAGNNGFATMLGGDYIDDPDDISNVDLAIHFKFGPASWSLEIVAAGDIATVANGTFSSTLAKDDSTVHTAELKVRGSTIHLSLPDGTTDSASSAGIGSLPQGPWATFEVAQSNASADTKPKFTEVWADGSGPRAGSVGLSSPGIQLS